MWSFGEFVGAFGAGYPVIPLAKDAEDAKNVGAFGAGYPVIPLAKAQRTQSSQRKKKGFLYVIYAC